MRCCCRLVTILSLAATLALAESAADASECAPQSFPHDRKAFTQGLVFYQGHLLESTGRYSHSSLRRVVPETGVVLLQHDLPADVFAEGLALHNGTLYQLTWHNERVYTYDPNTLQPTGQIDIDGEAWGLASDGERLIMSDGSAVLRDVDPKTFDTLRRITVTGDRGEVSGLNELEFVAGQLYANIYPTDMVVIIDLETGRINDTLDLSAYRRDAASENAVDVPNGIAYDPTTNCLYITGKLWPRLYRLNAPGTGTGSH